MYSSLTEIFFSKGLNLLVGENGCGKSTVIDAIRALLNESEYSRRGTIAEDFYNPYDKTPSIPADCIHITGCFSDLSEEQKVEYLTWLIDSFDANLNLEIQHTLNLRNNYKQRRWGGTSSNSAFDWEPLNDIQCVYLPALRDAERSLKSGRGSRLARVIANLSASDLKKIREKADFMPLEKDFMQFNDVAIKENEIIKANDLINSSLENAAGIIYGQQTKIQFNNLTYERIIESLQLLFAPEIDNQDVIFRSLFENSLGYNNLIYIATILAEFEGLKEQYTTPRILLIEELEAHLHPQLQIKLLKYLQNQAELSDIQVIITTHSISLASSVSIDNIISFNQVDDKYLITSLCNCGLDNKAKRFIDRWLDATKSTLLFSKGNIFVEGISEAIIIPKLANVYLKKRWENGCHNVRSLEEAGISVINMNGIYFPYFMQLYNGYKLIFPKQGENESKSVYNERFNKFRKKDKYDDSEYSETAQIPQFCVALTDNDTEKNPQKGEHFEGSNSQLYYGEQLKNMTENCRVFVNEKTFEYDLALESHYNAKVMLNIILNMISTDGNIKKQIEQYLVKLDEPTANIDDSQMAAFILAQVDSNYIGKGLFAQLLYDQIDEQFEIPQYITDAFDFILHIG
jgi:putative ATP-dependent endonuclease of OLD family